jgi:hypothetical protein
LLDTAQVLALARVLHSPAVPPACCSTTHSSKLPTGLAPLLGTPLVCNTQLEQAKKLDLAATRHQQPYSWHPQTAAPAPAKQAARTPLSADRDTPYYCCDETIASRSHCAPSRLPSYVSKQPSERCCMGSRRTNTTYSYQLQCKAAPGGPAMHALPHPTLSVESNTNTHLCRSLSSSYSALAALFCPGGRWTAPLDTTSAFWSLLLTAFWRRCACNAPAPPLQLQKLCWLAPERLLC